MSSEWQTVQLKDIADLKGGNAFKSGEYSTEGVFVLRTVNINEDGSITEDGAKYVSDETAAQYKRFYLQEWDTLFVMVGATLGKTGLVREYDLPALLNQNMWVVRATSAQINPRYLHYAFNEETKALLGFASGAARDFVRRDDFRKMELRIPPKKTQDHISNFVGAIDDKVRLNNQINQTLEQMAQAIFKSWFVDFEPVKAKITALEAGGSEEDALLAAMQAISGKDAAALAHLQTENPDQYAELRTTAELFPSAMQDSELGEIPVGWNVKELSTEIDVLNGFAFKSIDYIDCPGTFVLRTKNFNNSGVAERLPDDVFLPDSFKDSHKKYLCEAYDYHLVMVGASVGKTSMIFPSEIPALRNQNMWCFRPKSNSIIGKAFSKYMLDSLILKKRGLASGSAREFFRKGDFQKQKICFATESIQQAFHGLVFPFLQSRAINIAESCVLSELRDGLLPKLLSGEVTVTDIALQPTVEDCLTDMGAL